MAKLGAEYQEKAATFFRTLGLDAVVEADVVGARGKHEIDVWVTGCFHSLPIKWAVECKAGKARVRKAPVMTLDGIVKDIGADKGFLLSESGFQSGAIQCARHTNIILTSLKAMRNSGGKHIFDSIYLHLHTRSWRLLNELKAKEWFKKEQRGNRQLLAQLIQLNGRLKAVVDFGSPELWVFDPPHDDEPEHMETASELLHDARVILDRADELLKTGSVKFSVTETAKFALHLSPDELTALRQGEQT